MPETYFAPAGRVPEDELNRQQALIASEPLLEAVADSVTVRFLVLNDQRQIVYGNMPQVEAGKRHGEAFHCIYAYSGPGGCGTSKACALCGAAQAVVESINERRQTVRECRMVVEPLEGHDFEVTATPFEVAGQPFTIVFFAPVTKKQPAEVAKAERGLLEAKPVETPVREIFTSLGQTLNVPVGWVDSDGVVTVDPNLLVYALANLVEYGAVEGAVTVSYERTREHQTFVVDTRRVVPDRSRTRLFDSGKLYIARLFGERVLGGRVWLTTSDAGEARFHVGFGIVSQVDPRY